MTPTPRIPRSVSISSPSESASSPLSPPSAAVPGPFRRRTDIGHSVSQRAAVKPGLPEGAERLLAFGPSLRPRTAETEDFLRSREAVFRFAAAVRTASRPSSGCFLRRQRAGIRAQSPARHPAQLLDTGPDRRDVLSLGDDEGHGHLPRILPEDPDSFSAGGGFRQVCVLRRNGAADRRIIRIQIEIAPPDRLVFFPRARQCKHPAILTRAQHPVKGRDPPPAVRFFSPAKGLSALRDLFKRKLAFRIDFHHSVLPAAPFRSKACSRPFRLFLIRIVFRPEPFANRFPIRRISEKPRQLRFCSRRGSRSVFFHAPVRSLRSGPGRFSLPSPRHGCDARSLRKPVPPPSFPD